MSSGAFLQVNENSEIVRQGLEDLGADIPKVGRMGIYKTARRIIKRMRQPGSPIVYPVDWDTQLQHDAFFASDGFGAGIPTGRSGQYQDGWEAAEKMPDGYRIGNDTPQALFVGGDELGNHQSSIHKDRWPLFATVALEEIYQLPDDVVEQLKLTALEDGIEVT